jgi:hypothetical protein
MIFKHSGTFGDLIYSLYAVKKMGGGTIAIALHNIERCVAAYGYRPDEVDPAHRGRFTEQDFAILKPLLMRQDYINDVVVWDGTHDVDLDRFRGVLFRGFEGNYVQAMCMTHNLPFDRTDLEQPWLTADIYRKRPVVVNRTLRYRDMEAGDKIWRQMYKDGYMADSAVFVGNDVEYDDFVNMIGPIERVEVADISEMADLINGCDLFVGNQSLAYSLAIGLGKTTVLETIKIKPLINNECYFPRSNCSYF